MRLFVQALRTFIDVSRLPWLRNEVCLAVAASIGLRSHARPNWRDWRILPAILKIRTSCTAPAETCPCVRGIGPPGRGMMMHGAPFRDGYMLQPLLRSTCRSSASKLMIEDLQWQCYTRRGTRKAKDYSVARNVTFWPERSLRRFCSRTFATTMPPPREQIFPASWAFESPESSA
jgi:hypothetical protein